MYSAILLSLAGDNKVEFNSDDFKWLSEAVRPRQTLSFGALAVI